MVLFAWNTKPTPNRSAVQWTISNGPLNGYGPLQKFQNAQRFLKTILQAVIGHT